MDTAGVVLCLLGAVHCSHEDCAYDTTTSSGLVWGGAARVRMARARGPGAGAGCGHSWPSRQRPGRGAAGRDRPGPGAEHRRFHQQRRPVHDPGTGRSRQRAGRDVAGAHHRAQARGASGHPPRRRADGGLHARHRRQPARGRRGDGSARGHGAGQGAVQCDDARRLEATGTRGRPAAGAAGEDSGEHRGKQRPPGCAGGRLVARADVAQRVRPEPGPARHRGRRHHQWLAPGPEPQRHRDHRGGEGRRGCVALWGASRQRRHQRHDEVGSARDGRRAVQRAERSGNRRHRAGLRGGQVPRPADGRPRPAVLHRSGEHAIVRPHVQLSLRGVAD